MLRQLNLLLLAAVPIVDATVESRQASSTTIPGFVLEYAPLIYLDTNESYFPSDIAAQLLNTRPIFEFDSIIDPAPSPLTLSNLAEVNIPGECTAFSNCNVFLTSGEDITTNPPYLYGTRPDPVTGLTRDAKSCAVVVYEHADGTTVDVFYFFFYAYNLGPTVLGEVLGNHVGDWEHTMIRFRNEEPVEVWLSQHEYGAAFTYASVSKNGTRPIFYSAVGTHATYATPGTQARKIAGLTVNDYTSNGTRWDPIGSALFYAFTPSTTPSPVSESSFTNGTFTALNSTVEDTPISWLYFLGRWGDERYPDTDDRQLNFGGLNVSWRYETGPTGPLDKALVRGRVCPDVRGRECVLTSELSPGGNSSTTTVGSGTTSSSGSIIPTTAGTATGGIQTTEVGTETGTATVTNTGSGNGSTSGTPSETGTSGAGKINAGVWSLGALVLELLFI